MKGDERRVVDALCAWLKNGGWEVRTEVDWVDVLATRNGETLYIEAKGRSTAPGLDVDTAFGQLLRRMGTDDDPKLRYAIAVRDEPRSIRAIQRVPARVLDRLRISLYAVADGGSVRELTGR